MLLSYLIINLDYFQYCENPTMKKKQELSSYRLTNQLLHQTKGSYPYILNNLLRHGFVMKV